MRLRIYICVCPFYYCYVIIILAIIILLYVTIKNNNSNNNNRKTKMMLFRNNPFRPKRIYIGDDVSLRGANMMQNLTTVIYVHGFTEQGNSKGAETIKKGIIKKYIHL